MSAAAVEKGPDATVNDVTATLSNTSISNKADDNKAADEKAAADAASASAAEGRRLYIGNLAYASTEGELKTFFTGYLVESVSIPKNPRTDKAVGYAFVDLSTPSEAERAIAELSGKEILERKVSVQLAHKPEAHKEVAEGANGQDAEGTRRRGSGRTRGRGRNRGGRGGARGANADNASATDAAVDTEAAPAATEVQPLSDITNANPTNQTEKKTQQRPRERRERGPPADGVASKTKVMVANLPYDLNEEKLKELFAAYQPSSVKIALRPIPRFMIKKLQARGEPRKGRGFGFVTLATEEQQQKAVSEMNGKDIDGREIAVKVAIDSPDKTDDNEGDVDADAEETPAAATTEVAADTTTTTTENTTTTPAPVAA